MRLASLAALTALFATAHAQTLIVGNKGEHTVSFVDLATGQEVARRETGRFPHEIAVSPDGALAVVVSYAGPGFQGNTLHLFDVASAEMVGDISLGESRAPHGLKWIPGTDQVIVTTEASQDTVIVEPVEKRVVGRIRTDQQGSHMVAVSPDAARAFVANIGSGTFTVLDLETRSKVQDVEAGTQTEAIAVTPDGNEIYVGNNASKNVMVFDAESLERLHTLDTAGVPIRVEIRPDGEQFAVSQPLLGSVAFYRTSDREELGTVELGEGTVPVTLLYANDGSVIWAAATGAQKVFEIDTETLVIRRSFDVGEGSDGLIYSPLNVEVHD